MVLEGLYNQVLAFTVFFKKQIGLYVVCQELRRHILFVILSCEILLIWDFKDNMKIRYHADKLISLLYYTSERMTRRFAEKNNIHYDRKFQ